MSSPRFHPEARQDFDDAFAFLAERSPTAAARFAQRVAEALRLVAAFPDAGRTLTGPFRTVLIPPYPFDVVYRSEADGRLTVLAVAHHRREPGYWRHRR